MRPTEILASEHRVIEQVLDCLELLAHRAVDAAQIESEDARRCLELLTTLLDRGHRGKEEQQLFPALVRRAPPALVALIAELVREHELGRNALRSMREAIEGEALDPRGCAQQFARAALGYVELQRAHMVREEGPVFQAADALLDAADDRQLQVLFDSVERLDLEPGTRHRLLARADELAVCLGVQPRAERSDAAVRG